LIKLLLKDKHSISISKTKMIHLNSIIILIRQETESGAQWPQLEGVSRDSAKAEVAKLGGELVIQDGQELLVDGG
jgi:hypothetical protein